jgi:UDP-N-acetylglucosamine 2-epimerase (non-hydrolysing)
MMICNVVGARPNYMKMAPIVLELKARGLPQVLLHTGQHYDDNMSAVFFTELGMPEPDVHLGVGSGTHTRQTAAIMIAFEEACRTHRPDLIIVGGDVNSTLAVALVGAKLLIPVAHVESGLRSFDRTMPEEINRILTDHVAELLFVTERSGMENLAREGIEARKVHFVGNCMVDTLLKHVSTAVARQPWRDFDLAPAGYAVLTLHRPSNVDDPASLAGLLRAVNEVSRRLPVVFPAHPRTRQRLTDGRMSVAAGVRVCDPLPYLAFLGLMARAKCIMTDSGGIQEEATALDVPCLTLRTTTERPVTLTEGSNRLVGTAPDAIQSAVDDVLAGRWTSGRRPPLWDGLAAARTVDVLEVWARGG